MKLKRKSPTGIRMTPFQTAEIARICAETNSPRNKIIRAALDLYLADRAAAA
jgi:Ribbon-helix-helix protein, copG family